MVRKMVEAVVGDYNVVRGSRGKRGKRRKRKGFVVGGKQSKKP